MAIAGTIKLGELLHQLDTFTSGGNVTERAMVVTALRDFCHSAKDFGLPVIRLDISQTDRDPSNARGYKNFFEKEGKAVYVCADVTPGAMGLIIVMRDEKNAPLGVMNLVCSPDFARQIFATPPYIVELVLDEEPKEKSAQEAKKPAPAKEAEAPAKPEDDQPEAAPDASEAKPEAPQAPQTPAAPVSIVPNGGQQNTSKKHGK